MKKLTIFALVLTMLVAPLSSVFAAMPEQDLSVGSRGEAVLWLQNELISLKVGAAAQALATAGASGFFGILTRAALSEYQQSHNVAPAQGYFGPKTRALFKADVKGDEKEDDSGTSKGVTFSGTISAVNTGCFADGQCSVVVDGKIVVLATGLRLNPPPIGSLKGVDSIGDLEDHIGAQAKVYAASTPSGYTLYGSKDYYVEVLPKKAVDDKGKTVTVTGRVECLPAKDNVNPVIALCAIGIKTDDGTYYALEYNTDVSSANLATDERVKITGTLRSGVTHPVFKGEGTIKVKSIIAID
jgi:peptidoglycan hydrolase-like protein with peptidoglycan-binding domain